MTSTLRFSVSPNPAAAGSTVTICYETAGAALPVHCKVIWDPGLGEQKFTIEQADLPEDATVLCCTATVPAGCQGGLLVDGTAQSDDLAITVTP